MKKLTRLFFATDIHGSDKCWKKFINAGKFYEADVLILGGDMTGKGLVPVIRSDNRFKAEFRGKKYTLNNEKELEKFEKMIAMSGYYIYYTTPEELEELSTNPKKLDSIFIKLMVERIQQWLKFADERLKGTGIKCYVCPGNDDHFEINELFKESSTVIDVSDKVIEIDNNHEMINIGWSNPTPWNTPRECSEEELAKRIEEQVSKIKDVKNSIFQLHAPPYGSQLDNAPKLDESLKIAYGEMIPVGSKAVKEAIEKYQPLLGLHGHIHESDGVVKIGRTLCINPGSVYTEGILRGVVINLNEDSVKSYYPVSG
ncbi:MAG: metallophosphoesterase [Candidatus Bathyarchaeia archaeon]